MEAWRKVLRIIGGDVAERFLPFRLAGLKCLRFLAVVQLSHQLRVGLSLRLWPLLNV